MNKVNVMEIIGKTLLEVGHVDNHGEYWGNDTSHGNYVELIDSLCKQFMKGGGEE